uniref:AIG1-type G domain-containing protein n=1 Tax=Lepisosteus oculatus TaxID=7918 RepID=W5NJF9_LEPOC
VLAGTPLHVVQVIEVLLGRVWTGKSSAGNTILGREEFDTRRLTEECEKRQGEVAGRLLTVIDTPGWYSLQDTADWLKKEIVRSVSLCPPGPHSFLLTIPLAPFTEQDRRAVEEHLGLLGDRVWRHTLVLFTWGDGKGGTGLEQAIKRGGEDLQRLVEKCGNRVHVLHNNNTGDRGQVTELLEKIEALVAGSPDAFFLGSDGRITQEEQEKKQRDQCPEAKEEIQWEKGKLQQRQKN